MSAELATGRTRRSSAARDSSAYSRSLHARAVENVLKPFVHPCVFELVVAHHPVPELVAGLVHRDAFGRVRRARRQPARAGGEERRILHAARAALVGRIDDRDVAVRIGAVPFAVVPQRRGVASKWRSACAACSGCSSSRISTGGRPGCSNRAVLYVVGARRPRKVVDVVLVVAMRRRADRRCPSRVARRRSRRPSSRGAP